MNCLIMLLIVFVSFINRPLFSPVLSLSFVLRLLQVPSLVSILLNFLRIRMQQTGDQIAFQVFRRESAKAHLTCCQEPGENIYISWLFFICRIQTIVIECYYFIFSKLCFRASRFYVFPAWLSFRSPGCAFALLVELSRGRRGSPTNPHRDPHLHPHPTPPHPHPTPQGGG